MISLEQIRTLDLKVQTALELIVSLRAENSVLRDKLGNYEKRTEELETLVNSFNRDQDDIENGILGILQQLDKLEGDLTEKSISPGSSTDQPKSNAAPEEKVILSENSEELSAAQLTEQTDEYREPEPAQASGEAELDIF